MPEIKATRTEIVSNLEHLDRLEFGNPEAPGLRAAIAAALLSYVTASDKAQPEELAIFTDALNGTPDTVKSLFDLYEDAILREAVEGSNFAEFHSLKHEWIGDLIALCAAREAFLDAEDSIAAGYLKPTPDPDSNIPEHQQGWRYRV